MNEKKYLLLRKAQYVNKRKVHKETFDYFFFSYAFNKMNDTEECNLRIENTMNVCKETAGMVPVFIFIFFYVHKMSTYALSVGIYKCCVRERKYCYVCVSDCHSHEECVVFRVSKSLEIVFNCRI